MKTYLLSAALLLASLGLVAPASYAAPAHSGAASSQIEQPTNANLRFVPVQTAPDWQAAGLSLKRAELSPGIWGYMLTSSQSGQQFMFSIANKGQAKLLWSNTPTKANGNQSNASPVVKPNAAHQCPCYIHRSPQPNGNVIVTMTDAFGNVIAIWVVTVGGKVIPIYN